MFFYNIYDRDTDGCVDDWFIMCGVVEKVRVDDMVIFVGFVCGVICWLVMNLCWFVVRCDEFIDVGDLNSFLCQKCLFDCFFIVYLVGEFYVFFVCFD